MSYISFDTFTNDDAYAFFKHVLDIISENKLKPVRIRVVKDDDIVFQYKMEGKVGDEWLNRKQKTIEETHIPTLEVFNHKDDYPHMNDNDEYAVCGGAYPLLINDQYRGCFIISGLEHTEDHKLIVDALERMNK